MRKHGRKIQNSICFFTLSNFPMGTLFNRVNTGHNGEIYQGDVVIFYPCLQGYFIDMVEDFLLKTPLKRDQEEFKGIGLDEII